MRIESAQVNSQEERVQHAVKVTRTVLKVLVAAVLVVATITVLYIAW